MWQHQRRLVSRLGLPIRQVRRKRRLHPVRAGHVCVRTEGAAFCEPCEHGTFSQAGSAECEPCFSDGAALACDVGLQAFASVTAIDAYFALHPGDKYNINSRKRMFEFCHARGVCLPCQPGHYEQGGACIQGPFAEYQPHFQATQCFACAYGHNTSRTGAETESECLCKPGFE